jgi:riboflavin biosynthesis pyrimidine reductase
MSGEGPLRLLFGGESASLAGSPDGLDDDQLLALYGPEDRLTPRLRANFIASVDGSASASGLSGDLGGPADRRVFDLLRQLCDVVIVAAGTIRTEGYGPMRLPAAAEEWRVANGLAPQPAFAIVSGSLALDPASNVFTDAPVRPLVLTADSADAERRAALVGVADVVSCGATTVEPEHLVATLIDRGLPQMHCEGGPSLLGALIESDVLDSLCLTISPSLEGGVGPRIARGHDPVDLRAMTLDHVLLASGMLLTQYSRARA